MNRAHARPKTSAAPDGETPAPRPGQLAGLFLLSAATILLQISWTRVLSVSLWYHFAFLVISTAMLGFGLGGVVFATSRRVRALRPDRALPLFAAGQALATVFGFWAAQAIPFAPFSLLAEPRQLLFLPLYMVCIATPFAFSGLAGVTLLSRLSRHAGRIYGFDLAGAALGSVALIAVMPAGGSTAVVASAALAATAAVLFAGRSTHRALAALLVLGLAILSSVAEQAIPLRISPTKLYGRKTMHELLRSPARLYTGWNTFSRVDVLPYGRGMRQIVIDAGAAVTRLPAVRRPPIVQGSVTDERRLVLDPELDQSVLVFGSGGGQEVLAALRTRAKQVTAVEVNPLINELVRYDMAEYVGHIFSDPRVELHTAEARSFIRRSPRHYDVIMAEHAISNAATAAGALSLAETYMLTLEAFGDYLSHLSSEGMLWFTRPEPQMPRLVATIRQALAQAGAPRPAFHVIAFARGPAPAFSAGVLVGRQPFLDEFVSHAEATFARLGLRPLHLPGRAAGPPIYREILRADEKRLEALYASSPVLLRPATDDRPFFNQRSRWRDIDLAMIARVFAQRARGRMALEDLPVSEVVLLVALLQSALLALVIVALPLALRSSRSAPGAAPSSARSAGDLLYFFLLGLGFILAEVALIQRLTLFLGQPVHAFATVVAALLLASGVGSLLSQRLAGSGAHLSRPLRALLGLVALALLVFVLGSGPLLRALLGLPLGARVGVTALMLFPIGLLMGACFPLGLRLTSERAPTLVPWAWGLNAVASVVGSVLAAILATLVGFSGVLTIAASCYALAALLWLAPGAWHGARA